MFIEDNAQVHRVSHYLEFETLVSVELPSLSPDLNPTDHVWNMQRRRLHSFLEVFLKKECLFYMSEHN